MRIIVVYMISEQTLNAYLANDACYLDNCLKEFLNEYLFNIGSVGIKFIPHTVLCEEETMGLEEIIGVKFDLTETNCLALSLTRGHFAYAGIIAPTLSRKDVHGIELFQKVKQIWCIPGHL